MKKTHGKVLALAETRPDVMWDGLDLEATRKKHAVADEDLVAVSSALPTSSTEPPPAALPEPPLVVLDQPDARQRPTRRGRAQVDYVKLNEQLNDAKRLKEEEVAES